MLQENQRENDKKQYSMFFPEDDRSKSYFLNPQYLNSFLEATNNYYSKREEVQGKQDDKNQEKALPIVFQSEQEPRYVNQKQYHRMMVRRIKRAQQAIKWEEERKKEMLNGKHNKKYIYESRHQHALKRERGPDGKFLRKGESDKKQTEDSKQE